MSIIPSNVNSDMVWREWGWGGAEEHGSLHTIQNVLPDLSYIILHILFMCFIVSLSYLKISLM